jgi:uncharacterized CHY-type Zn-finger protein
MAADAPAPTPAAAPAPAGTAASTLQAPPTLTRSLRDNVPFTMPEPTQPQTFTGYPGAPPFTVVPRKDKLTFFPCSNCHAVLPPNPEVRKLSGAPHPAALNHGNGRIWCLDCHQLKDRDHLHTLSGQSVDFNDAYLVCGQCHANRQKDWFFGAHGKRVANWRGERVIYNCTYCHDPHSPSLKPRAPSRPPPVRAGLKPMPAYPDPAVTGAIVYQAPSAGASP